jgi:hypothetical protein
MPWRRKPASFLRYWSGPVRQDENFKAVIVYCVGAQGHRCYHNNRLNLADLPDWDWHDVSAHLRCTQCGAVGWVKAAQLPAAKTTLKRLLEKRWVERQGIGRDTTYKITNEGIAAKMAPIPLNRP